MNVRSDSDNRRLQLDLLVVDVSYNYALPFNIVSGMLLNTTGSIQWGTYFRYITLSLASLRQNERRL